MGIQAEYEVPRGCGTRRKTGNRVMPRLRYLCYDQHKRKLRLRRPWRAGSHLGADCLHAHTAEVAVPRVA
jgi:hypothetical protein